MVRDFGNECFESGVSVIDGWIQGDETGTESEQDDLRPCEAGLRKRSANGQHSNVYREYSSAQSSISMAISRNLQPLSCKLPKQNRHSGGYGTLRTSSTDRLDTEMHSIDGVR